MKKFIVTMVLSIEESCEGRRPDSQMIKRYLANKISRGVVHDDCFRGKVIMKIIDIKIGAFSID